MNKPGRKSAASLAVVTTETPKQASLELPAAPKHLSEEASQWWRTVVQDYELEPHHCRLLQAACEAWDRMQIARKAVAAEGITFKAANGDLKANPAVAIERDARTAFARLVRELDLDAGAPAESKRPPSILSNRR